MLYEVRIPATCASVFKVEANSEEEAIDKVANGEVDECEPFQYHELDQDTNFWGCRELN